MVSKPQEIIMIVRPLKLKRANFMVALTLRSITLSQDIEYVLADLPRGFEVVLKQYEKVEDVLSMAAKLGLLSWSESMMRAHEPIVSCLSRLIKESVKVVCYLDPSELERERELAFKISQLTLRASIKELDEKDLKEWIQVLREYSPRNWKVPDSLMDSLKKIESSCVVVLTGLEGFQYAENLRNQGLKVRIEAVGLPYLRNPLEIMTLKYLRGELTTNELKALVKEYVNYMRNYVVRCESLEEAHERWTSDRAPWFKSLLQPREEDNVNAAIMYC